LYFNAAVFHAVFDEMEYDQRNHGPDQRSSDEPQEVLP
jgi:hypothetical protein